MGRQTGSSGWTLSIFLVVFSGQRTGGLPKKLHGCLNCFETLTYSKKGNKKMSDRSESLDTEDEELDWTKYQPTSGEELQVKVDLI